MQCVVNIDTSGSFKYIAVVQPSSQPPNVPIAPAATGQRLIFTTRCPVLAEDFKLLSDTWYGHILKIHPYMKKKEELIKRAIESITDKKMFFRLAGDPADSWFTDYQCPDFLPMHKSLRVAFKRLPNTGVIVATAYKLEKGIVSYE